MEFCALPASMIAELPLSMFKPLNKWFEKNFNWLSNGPIYECMSDFKDDHPKIFWSTAIIWIPILIIVGFYIIDLLFICGISAVVFVICITIAFTIICKLIHIANIIIHPAKHIR